MCGRFTLKTPVIDWLMSLFPVHADGLHSDGLRRIAMDLVASHPTLALPRYNIAPTQSIWVVVQHSDRDLPEVRAMRWGLVPAWADSTKVAYSMINARTETLREKPSFKNLLPDHRCIVVADGYYEWIQQPVPATPKQPKQPYWIHRSSDEPFAMAGLWTENRRVQPNQPLQSATLITTHANADTIRVHDRMPVVLQDAQAIQQWLALDTPSDDIAELLKPAESGFFETRHVSTRVNTPSQDSQELIAGVD